MAILPLFIEFGKNSMVFACPRLRFRVACRMFVWSLFCSASKGLLPFFLGIAFKGCPFGGYIFALFSFLFSALGKETPYLGHIKRTYSLSFLFLEIGIFPGDILYIYNL